MFANNFVPERGKQRNALSVEGLFLLLILNVLPFYIILYHSCGLYMNTKLTKPHKYPTLLIETLINRDILSLKLLISFTLICEIVAEVQ